MEASARREPHGSASRVFQRKTLKPAGFTSDDLSEIMKGLPSRRSLDGSEYEPRSSASRVFRRKPLKSAGFTSDDLSEIMKGLPSRRSLDGKEGAEWPSSVEDMIRVRR